jgi:putative endonuclease
VARGRAVAAVEVKRRTTVEAALEAVSLEQRRRLRRALAAFAGRRPRLKDASLRLDLIALAPGRRPRHIPAAWSEDGEG